MCWHVGVLDRSTLSVRNVANRRVHANTCLACRTTPKREKVINLLLIIHIAAKSAIIDTLIGHHVLVDWVVSHSTIP